MTDALSGSALVLASNLCETPVVVDFPGAGVLPPEVVEQNVQTIAATDMLLGVIVDAYC